MKKSETNTQMSQTFVIYFLEMYCDGVIITFHGIIITRSSVSNSLQICLLINTPLIKRVVCLGQNSTSMESIS